MPEGDFVEHFAGDIDPARAKVMHAVQQPIAALRRRRGHGRAGLEVASVLVPGGRRNDEAIPPDAERLFASRMGATTVEAASNHVAMVSHPDEVAKLIETAAGAVG